MPAIYAEVQGDKDRLMARLRKLADIRKAEITANIAEELRTSTVLRFQLEKSPEGKPWRTSIRARDQGGKTLTDTGRLKTSILATSDETGLAVGTNTIYAAAHQFGLKQTIRPKKAKVLRFQIGGKWVSAKEVHQELPARPFLGLSDDDQAFIKAEFDRALGE